MIARDRILAALGELGEAEAEILAQVAERLRLGRQRYQDRPDAWLIAERERDYQRDAREDANRFATELALALMHGDGR